MKNLLFIFFCSNSKENLVNQRE